MKPHACLLLLAALAACVLCCHAHRAPDDTYTVPEPEVKYEPRHDREGYKKQGEEYTHAGKEKEYDHGHEQYGPGQYNKKEYSDGYTKYSYDYKSRDKPPKEYKEDYGPPPYNPKAHENYEYDRYHSYGSYPPPGYPYAGAYPNYPGPYPGYPRPYPGYPRPYPGYPGAGPYPGYPEGPDSYGRYPGYPEGPDSYGPEEHYPEGYEGPEPYEGYSGYKQEGPEYEGGPEYPEYPENEYESYGGGYGYGEKMPDCRNPHEWPLAYARLLCVNPKSGVLNYYNASAQTCLGIDQNSGTEEHPKVCVQWPGTDYSCTFSLSPATKPCRKASDKCDVTEYCTGTWWQCPTDDVADNSILCRMSRGPCEWNAYCTGGSKECPDNYVPQNTECGDPDKPLAGPCDAKDVCTGSDYKCPDTFQDNTHTCRAAEGPCDLEDHCNGASADCPNDDVKAKGTVCNADTLRPCILGGKCDGTAKTCPALTHAPTGTPCNKDGLWEEAMDGQGKVAIKSRYSKEHADMHGWVECDRCYEGECQTFKWEYWNADKHSEGKGDGKHDDKGGDGKPDNGDGGKPGKSSSGSHKTYKHTGYKGSKKSSGHKASVSAAAEAPEVVEFEAQGTSEYYPTKIFETLGVEKASIQSSYGEGGDYHKKAVASYEPEVYCHNPYANTDYNTAPKSAV